MIGRRLSDVIDPTPDKLTHAERVLHVIDDHPFQVRRSPAGIAVAEGGTLLVCFRHDVLFDREMIDSPAGEQAGCLAAIDNPGRVLSVMLFIEFFAVIVADCIHIFSTALSAFPRHVVAAEGHCRMSFRIMDTDLVRQEPRDRRSPFVRMHVIDLVADGPHDHGRMAAVPPDP